MARPKGSTKDITKNKSIHIRLTEQELEMIEECSKLLKVSRAKAILLSVEKMLKSLV